MELNDINYEEFNQDLQGLSLELDDTNSELRHDIHTEVLNIPVVQVDESPMLPTILEDVRGDESNVSTTTTMTTTTTNKKKKWKFKDQFSSLVSSIFHTSTRIDWKNKQYDCPEFRKNSPAKSAENLDLLVFKVKKHGTEAERYKLPKTTKDVQNHANLEKIFLDLLSTKWFVIKLEPKSTSTSSRRRVGGGVYALFGKSKEKGCFIEKFGMSNQSVGFRLTTQKKEFLFAALVMNTEQVDRFIPDRFVDAIIALELAYYNVHPDHNDYKRLNIKLQLTEMLFGIIYKNNSRPYGENLVAVPSDEVRELSKVVSFTKEQIDIFKNKITADDGLLFVTSWPPLRYYLYELSESQPNNTFLRHKLLEERPGDVTVGISEMLYEDYYRGNEDIYKENPRAIEVQVVVDNIQLPLILIKFLEGSALYNKEDLIPLQSVVSDCLDPLRGDNYDHFVRPKINLQAKSAKSTFPVIFSKASKNKCFTTERHCLYGICDNDIEQFINWNERKQLIDGSLDALSVTTTKRQQPMMISSSHYIAFADNNRMNTRLTNSGHFSTQVDYCVATNNVTKVRGDILRARLLTYMMSIDTNINDNAFHQARRLFFPKGYFPVGPKNILKVSIPLEIGYQEMMLIRHQLGPGLTYHLLRCHDLLSNVGEDDTRSNPIEVTRTQPFVCPSPPNMDGYMKVTCNHTSQDYNLCGRDNIGYPFPKLFLCAICKEVMRRREQMFYKITKIEELNPQQIVRRDEIVDMIYRRAWKRYDVPNNHPTQISKDEIATMLTVNDVFLSSGGGQFIVFGIIPGNLLYNELCDHNYKLWKVSEVDGKEIVVQQIYDYIRERHGRFIIKKAGVLKEVSEEDMTRKRLPIGRIASLLRTKSKNMTTDEIDAYHIENKHIYIDLSRMIEKKNKQRRQRCALCEERVVSGCNTCKKYVCRTHWDEFKESSCSSR